MNLLHWSDLHTDTEAIAALVRHTLAHFRPSATTIAITGDLTDSGTAAEFKRVAKALQPLADAGYALAIVPGNHDCGPQGIKWEKAARERFDRLIAAPLMGVEPGSRWPLVQWCGAWKLILLDSQEGNHDDLIVLARGELGKRQILGLEMELQDAVPTIVLLHHHPINADPAHELDEAKQLRRLLARRPHVHAVLFGHMHERRVWRHFEGIPYAADAGKTTAARDGHCVYTLHQLTPDGQHWTKDVKVPA